MVEILFEFLKFNIPLIQYTIFKVIVKSNENPYVYFLRFPRLFHPTLDNFYYHKTIKDKLY